MTQRVRKIFTLPPDLAERLENEENMSKVVSDLLREYYGMNTEKQEVKQRLEEIEKERSALHTKLGKIEEKEAQRDLDLYDYADFYENHREKWDDEREEEWLEESADNLGMNVSKLRDELKTLVNNGGA